MILNSYLNHLQESEEDICRKKHAAYKKKDQLGYRYLVKVCTKELLWKKLKPYDDKWRDINRNYCKNDEIKKRKGKMALMNPLAVRNCWKERDQKKQEVLKKSENIRKRVYELKKEIEQISKKLRERKHGNK